MLYEITVNSSGYNSTYDITDQVREMLSRLEQQEGILKLCAVGSTLGLMTMRYEPGCVEDLFQALSNAASADREFSHFRTTGDPNGFAHVWSSLIGTSVLIPYRDGQLAFSDTHRIVLFDFDLQPSVRRIYISP